MPIRSVKQKSDRGKLKDLVSSEDFQEATLPPTSYELRIQRLYDFSLLNRDKTLQAALGFITTDYISDKNALPLSAYRLRQIVDEIKSKSFDSINMLSQQIGGYINDEIGAEAIAYLNTRRARVKTASVKKTPIFWRASKS